MRIGYKITGSLLIALAIWTGAYGYRLFRQVTQVTWNVTPGTIVHYTAMIAGRPVSGRGVYGVVTALWLVAAAALWAGVNLFRASRKR